MVVRMREVIRRLLLLSIEIKRQREKLRLKVEELEVVVVLKGLSNVVYVVNDTSKFFIP